MIRRYPPTHDLDTLEQMAADHAHDDTIPAKDRRAVIVEMFTGDELTDESPGYLVLITGDTDGGRFDNDPAELLDPLAPAGASWQHVDTQTHYDEPATGIRADAS